MLSLIRAELYRSLRDKGLYVFVAAAFIYFFFFWNIIPIRSIGWLNRNIRDMGFPMIAASHGWENISSDPENITAFFDYYIRYAFEKILRNPTQPFFFSVFASALLIGTRFTRRTINIPICRGHSRASELLSIFFSYMIIITLTLATSFVLFLFLKFRTQWLIVLPTGYIIRCLLLWIYLAFSFMMIHFAVAFILKNVFGTMLVSVTTLLLVAILPNGTGNTERLFSSPKSFVPLSMMMESSLWKMDLVLGYGEVLHLILVPLSYILAGLFIAWLSFKHRELR